MIATAAPFSPLAQVVPSPVDEEPSTGEGEFSPLKHPYFCPLKHPYFSPENPLKHPYSILQVVKSK